MIPLLRRTELADWLAKYDALLGWLMFGSLALTVGTLLALPWIVSRIPDDYFATKERPPIRERSEHPVFRWTFRIGRNLLGVVLLLLGLVMVIGPGQGLIAILAGLLLADFPGKRRMEMWVIRRPGLLKAINWLRARRGRPPLEVWAPEHKRPDGPPTNPGTREREIAQR